MSTPSFRIEGHKLVGHWTQDSPNQGGPLDPSLVVLHYTAMPDIDAVERWLCNPEAEVSAHLIVGRDGQVRQIVPFDRVAWHAGKSEWRGETGLNSRSIGIELVNAGWLDRFEAEGCTRADLEECLPLNRVHLARHALGGPLRAWERFPEAQLATLDGLLAELRRAYPAISEIVGHDEIAPGRKEDPGPAFPMDRYR